MIAAKPDAMDLGFWRAVLGFTPMGDDGGSDPLGQGSTFWMQALDEAKPLQHAMHLDVSVAREQVEGRLAEALAAGGRVERQQQFERDGRWASWIRIPSGNVTGWHHHAANETYVYVGRGSVTLEFGSGGAENAMAGAGDFFHVPPGTIHRETSRAGGTSSLPTGSRTGSCCTAAQRPSSRSDPSAKRLAWRRPLRTIDGIEGSGALLTIVDASLTVRLTRDLWQLESRHVDLARAVSEVASAQGAVADRASVQEVQVAIAAKLDAMDVG